MRKLVIAVVVLLSGFAQAQDYEYPTPAERLGGKSYSCRGIEFDLGMQINAQASEVILTNMKGQKMQLFCRNRSFNNLSRQPISISCATSPARLKNNFQAMVVKNDWSDYDATSSVISAGVEVAEFMGSREMTQYLNCDR